LVEDHPKCIGDDAFVIGDEHPEPDSVVNRTRIHGTLSRKRQAASLGVLVP
jgi:hypothetical protein